MAIVTIVATYHFNNRVGRWFPIVPLSLPTLATVTAASSETRDSDGVSLPAMPVCYGKFKYASLSQIR